LQLLHGGFVGLAPALDVRSVAVAELLGLHANNKAVCGELVGVGGVDVLCEEGGYISAGSVGSDDGGGDGVAIVWGGNGRRSTSLHGARRRRAVVEFGAGGRGNWVKDGVRGDVGVIEGMRGAAAGRRSAFRRHGSEVAQAYPKAEGRSRESREEEAPEGPVWARRRTPVGGRPEDGCLWWRLMTGQALVWDAWEGGREYAQERQIETE
jgi:hypothetical protein